MKEREEAGEGCEVGTKEEIGVKVMFRAGPGLFRFGRVSIRSWVSFEQVSTRSWTGVDKVRCFENKMLKVEK